MRRLALLGLPLALVLLSGCGSTEPTPTSSPSPSATAEPAPTPTVSAPTKPALTDLVVSPNGLGPLVPGQAPPVTNPAVDILVFDPDACYYIPEGESSVPAMDDYGMWVSNYGVDPSTGDPGPFGVIVTDGIVTIIGIYSDELKTEAGAHLGMTRDELLAVYPSGLGFEPGEGLDTYRLTGTAGDLIFTLWLDESGSYQVRQINISSPGFTVPLGGSDFGFWGVCYGA